MSDIFIPGKEAGLILIHGFTGSPDEMEYIGREINRKKGWEVVIPCLPGHCTQPEDMDGVTLDDYLKKISTEYKKLMSKYDKVFVAGLSMGGLLTLEFSTKYRSVAAIVVMSAPMYLYGPHNRLILNFLNKFNIKTSFKYIKKKGRDIHYPPQGYQFKDYPWAPLNAVAELERIIKKVRTDLGLIIAPIQIFHSENDHTAPPESAEIIFKNVSSGIKELIYLKDSYHVLTLDIDREYIIKKMIHFLERFI